jgi:hypothetical protein
VLAEELDDPGARAGAAARELGELVVCDATLVGER